MNDCRYCGAPTQHATLMLVDGRLLDGGLPLLTRFHQKTRCAVTDLTGIEVGLCCEEYACLDLEHLHEGLLSLARDPSLEAKKALALWGSVEGDADFGVALLSNPNIPLQFVREHAPYYFEGVLENPSLMLWLLEDPDLLHSIAREFISAPGYGIDRGWRTPCSVAWLRYLSASDDLKERRFAASHAYLPEDCAWRLADDPDPCTRGYLSYHSTDAELLWYLAHDPDLETRELAARASSHPSVMARLAADASHAARVFVASSSRAHHELPQKLRWELYEEPTCEDNKEPSPLREKRQHQDRYLEQHRPRPHPQREHRERREEREFRQRSRH